MLVHQAYCWCVLIICILNFQLWYLTSSSQIPNYPSNSWASKQINDCTVHFSAASKPLFLQLETSISELTKTTRLDSVTRLSHMHASHNVQMSLMISFEFALLGFSADSHLYRCLSWKIHLIRFSKKEIVVFAVLNSTKGKRNPSPANISNLSNHHVHYGQNIWINP